MLIITWSGIPRSAISVTIVCLRSWNLSPFRPAEIVRECQALSHFLIGLLVRRCPQRRPAMRPTVAAASSPPDALAQLGACPDAGREPRRGLPLPRGETGIKAVAPRLIRGAFSNNTPP